MRRTYSDAEKAHALDLYQTDGPVVAAERTGIPKGTILSWAHRAGLQSMQPETVQTANRQRVQDLATRRLELAQGLLDDIGRLRSQLFAPCKQRIVKTVGTGKGYTETEVVDVELDQPTFGEQARIMTAIGIAVDKTQLLTGQATERHENIGETQVDEEIRRLTEQMAHIGAP